MCLFHVLSQDDELVSQEVTTEEWIEYFDTLPQCREMTVSGGESFLREDLDQLVLAAIEKTSQLFLNTNGILTSRLKGLLQKLDLEALHKITIATSLDGATPETHDRIRGVKGAMDKTIKSLQLLQDLDVRRAVTTVIQPTNYHELYDLYQICKEWDIHVAFQMILPRANFTFSQIEEIYRQLKRVWEETDKPEYEYYLRGVLHHQIHGKRPVPCYLGKSLIPLVDPLGDVYPCGNAPWMKEVDNWTPKDYGYPDLVMGNVRDKSLIEIINSDRAKEVLKRFDPETCHWCWSGCSYEPSFRYLQTLSEEEIIKIGERTIC